MPNPNKGEHEAEFLSRCMASPESNKSFPRQDQRYAFCMSQWKRNDKQTEAPFPNINNKQPQE